ncbi:mucin-22-like isoform X2 [Ornithodoros turicata]|uniref:mucin-22-like isoform X2 n=1 Tax=Ornithodoros turicata TaxID=34597 RepID=UPI00313A450F
MDRQQTVWPMLLDYTRDECQRMLRKLELEAYASVVSAFRAQGELTKDKKKMLQELCNVLCISLERHKAEVRRAVNDERLNTIADRIIGPNTMADWAIEGRRLIPLMPRLVPQTAFTTIANNAANIQAAKNATMPPPAATGTKDALTSVGNGTTSPVPQSTLATTTTTRVPRPVNSGGGTPTKAPSPVASAESVVVLPSGMSIHIKGGPDASAEDKSATRKRKRSLSLDSVSPPAKVSNGGSAPIVTAAPTKSVNVRFTVASEKTNSTVAPCASPKVIIVSTAGQPAMSSSLLHHSTSVPIVKTVSATGSIVHPGRSSTLGSLGSLASAITSVTSIVTTPVPSPVSGGSSTDATRFRPRALTAMPTLRTRGPGALGGPGAPQLPSPNIVHCGSLPTQGGAYGKATISVPKGAIMQYRQEGMVKVIAQSQLPISSTRVIPKSPAGGAAGSVTSTTGCVSSPRVSTVTVTGNNQARVVNVIPPTQAGAIRALSRMPGVTTLMPRSSVPTRVGVGQAGSPKPNVIVVHKAQVWPKSQAQQQATAVSSAKTVLDTLKAQRTNSTVTIVKPPPTVSMVASSPASTEMKKVHTPSVQQKRKQEGNAIEMQSVHAPSTSSAGLELSSVSQPRQSTLLADLIQAAGILPDAIAESSVPPVEIEVAIDSVPLEESIVVLESNSPVKEEKDEEKLTETDSVQVLQSQVCGQVAEFLERVGIEIMSPALPEPVSHAIPSASLTSNSSENAPAKDTNPAVSGASSSTGKTGAHGAKSTLEIPSQVRLENLPENAPEIIAVVQEKNLEGNGKPAENSVEGPAANLSESQGSKHTQSPGEVLPVSVQSLPEVAAGNPVGNPTDNPPPNDGQDPLEDSAENSGGNSRMNVGGNPSEAGASGNDGSSTFKSPADEKPGDSNSSDDDDDDDDDSASGTMTVREQKEHSESMAEGPPTVEKASAQVSSQEVVGTFREGSGQVLQERSSLPHKQESSAAVTTGQIQSLSSAEGTAGVPCDHANVSQRDNQAGPSGNVAARPSHSQEAGSLPDDHAASTANQLGTNSTGTSREVPWSDEPACTSRPSPSSEPSTAERRDGSDDDSSGPSDTQDSISSSSFLPTFFRNPEEQSAIISSSNEHAQREALQSRSLSDVSSSTCTPAFINIATPSCAPSNHSTVSTGDLPTVLNQSLPDQTNEDTAVLLHDNRQNVTSAEHEADACDNLVSSPTPGVYEGTVDIQSEVANSSADQRVPELDSGETEAEDYGEVSSADVAERGDEVSSAEQDVSSAQNGQEDGPAEASGREDLDDNEAGPLVPELSADGEVSTAEGESDELVEITCSSVEDPLVLRHSDSVEGRPSSVSSTEEANFLGAVEVDSQEASSDNQVFNDVGTSCSTICDRLAAQQTEEDDALFTGVESSRDVLSHEDAMQDSAEGGASLDQPSQSEVAQGSSAAPVESMEELHDEGQVYELLICDSENGEGLTSVMVDSVSSTVFGVQHPSPTYHLLSLPSSSTSAQGTSSSLVPSELSPVAVRLESSCAEETSGPTVADSSAHLTAAHISEASRLVVQEASGNNPSDGSETFHMETSASSSSACELILVGAPPVAASEIVIAVDDDDDGYEPTESSDHHGAIVLEEVSSVNSSAVTSSAVSPLRTTDGFEMMPASTFVLSSDVDSAGRVSNLSDVAVVVSGSATDTEVVELTVTSSATVTTVHPTDAGNFSESQPSTSRGTGAPTKRKRRAGLLGEGLSEGVQMSVHVSGWVRLASGLLERVCKYKGSGRGKGLPPPAQWFLLPVDCDDAPGYYDVISRPMDFSTIRKKLESGQYRDLTEFHEDMMLVKSNCETYNPQDHDARRDCQEIFAFYLQEYTALLEKLQKSHLFSSPKRPKQS